MLIGHNSTENFSYVKSPVWFGEGAAKNESTAKTCLEAPLVASALTVSECSSMPPKRSAGAFFHQRHGHGLSIPGILSKKSKHHKNACFSFGGGDLQPLILSQMRRKINRKILEKLWRSLERSGVL